MLKTKVMIAGALCGMAVWAQRSAALDVVPQDHPLRRKPTVVDVSGDALPNAAPLATPRTRTLLGYTRRPLHLPDGVTMGLLSYSGSKTANWLFLVDVRDLSFQRYEMPNHDIGTHGAALGADGNLYFMPYGNARAYRFDTRSSRFEQLDTELPEGEYTWDALGASNGCVYFGTYPNATFGEYNPATGKWTLWKQARPNTKYVNSFSEDGDGRIRCKAWGPEEVWLTFDPVSRRLEASTQPKSPPQEALSRPIEPPMGDASFGSRINAGGRWFAITRPSGHFCELPPEGKAIVRGDTGSPAEPRWWLKATTEVVSGVSYYGAMFRYDLNSGEFMTSHLDNLAPGGNPIMFLETITPRCAVGANYSQQNLFTVDPETGAVVESLRTIARVTGEPMCAVGFGGRAFLGIYVQSLISVYDPGQPFAWEKNPRELIALGERFRQTRPRAAVTDGRLVYVSSDSAYNHLGGALAVIDPETEQIDVYHHLIRDQNLPTLACDPRTKLLWGGTNRWGQMRSHPPTQESSLIYAFDPESRQVVSRLVPWPGSDETKVHGVSAGGILVASSGDEIALIHTETREILYQGASPLGIPGRLRLGADGRCYCLAAARLYRWNLAENQFEPVARSGACRFLTEVLPGLWLMADSQSVYHVRLRISPDE